MLPRSQKIRLQLLQFSGFSSLPKSLQILTVLWWMSSWAWCMSRIHGKKVNFLNRIRVQQQLVRHSGFSENRRPWDDPETGVLGRRRGELFWAVAEGSYFGPSQREVILGILYYTERWTWSIPGERPWLKAGAGSGERKRGAGGGGGGNTVQRIHIVGKLF